MTKLAKVNDKMDWISEKMENLILSMRTTQPSAQGSSQLLPSSSVQPRFPPTNQQVAAPVSLAPVMANSVSTGPGAPTNFGLQASLPPTQQQSSYGNTRSSFGKRTPGMPNTDQFCHFCWSTDDAYRRDCKVCQDDLNAGQIHITDGGKIGIERYSSGARLLIYRREKPQREYVADQEKLSYASPPLQTSVSTMRLGEESGDDLSSDAEQPNFVLLKHSPGVSSQAIVAAARTDTPKATKDPVQRILQRRISKEECYPASKTQRHGNWEPSRVEDVTDAEPMDEKVEIVDAIAENTKVEAPKPDLTKPKGDKKSKIFQHFRDSIEPGEIAQRIFSGQVALSIGKVIARSPDLQKLFTQAMASDKVVRFSVNPLDLDASTADLLPLSLKIGILWDALALL